MPWTPTGSQDVPSANETFMSVSTEGHVGSLFLGTKSSFVAALSKLFGACCHIAPDRWVWNTGQSELRTYENWFNPQIWMTRTTAFLLCFANAKRNAQGVSHQGHEATGHRRCLAVRCFFAATPMARSLVIVKKLRKCSPSANKRPTLDPRHWTFELFETQLFFDSGWTKYQNQFAPKTGVWIPHFPSEASKTKLRYVVRDLANEIIPRLAVYTVGRVDSLFFWLLSSLWDMIGTFSALINPQPRSLRTNTGEIPSMPWTSPATQLHFGRNQVLSEGFNLLPWQSGSKIWTKTVRIWWPQLEKNNVNPRLERLEVYSL